jgi:cell division protein FtsB
MVIRTRLRSILSALALYLLAGLAIAYFSLHAYSGNHGLRAKEDLTAQTTTLSAELAKLRAERMEWERRVALLRSDGLDPDMLDERARAMLDYVHPRDLVLMQRQPTATAAPTGAMAAAR